MQTGHYKAGRKALISQREGQEKEEEAQKKAKSRFYAAAGRSHTMPLAELGGAALGATAIGGGYARGALGYLGYHASKGQLI